MLTKRLNFYRENLSEALIVLLMFSLPFSRKFSSLLVILIVVLSACKLALSKDSRKRLYVHWALPLLFAFFYFVFVFECTFVIDWKKLFLIVIPISFGLTNQFFQDSLRYKIFGAYIFGNFVVSIICLVRATYFSFQFIDGEWKFIPQVVESINHDFLTSSVMGGNYYFGEQFSIFLHPGYFGLYIVFAQYLLFELAQSNGFKRRHYLVFGATYIFFWLSFFFFQAKRHK